MARVTTDGATDRYCRLSHRKALGALKGPVSFFTTNRTKLVFLQSTVQECQFTELSLFVDILFIVNHHQHLFDHVRCSIDSTLVFTRNDNVQRVVVAIHDFSVAASSRSLLDGSFPTDGNLATRLGL